MRAPSLIAVAAFLAVSSCSRSLAPTPIPDSAARVGVTSPVLGATPAPSPPLPAPEPGEAPTPTLVPGPRVTITSPRPSPLVAATVPPTFTIQWAGSASPVPKQYRYRLFAEDDREFDFSTLLANPDSVIRFYRPSFTGWTRVDGSVDQVTLHDLTPNKLRVLVVLAFDRSHYDPLLSLSTNMLIFNVAASPAPGTAGGTSADGGLDPTPRPRGH